METILRVDQNFTWKDVCNQYACRRWKWWIDNYGYAASLNASIVIVDSKQLHHIRNRLYNCEYPRHLFTESENTAQQVWRTFDKFDMVQLTTGVKMFTPIDEFVVKFPPQNSNKRATFGGLGCEVEDAVAFAYHKRSDEGKEDRDSFIQQCDVLNQIINGSLYRFVWHDVKNENDIGHTALGTLSDIVEFAEKCDSQIVFHCEPNFYQCKPDVLFHPELRPHRWYMSTTRWGDLDEYAKLRMIHPTHLQLIYEKSTMRFNKPEPIDKSVWTLQIPTLVPLELETETQRIVFEVWCRYVIDNPNLVIVGGNDNDDVSKSEFVQASRVSEISDEIAAMYSCSDCVVTQDDNTTTLFSPEKGKRVIIDWTKHGFPKLRMPALVDLKITDYCTFNCAFCYQGSTKQGKHVNIDELKQIIDVLSDSGVVELVVGGGEPTQHPDFKEFLQYTKQKHLSVSFTTRSETWINSKQNYWLDYTTGAVAFSIERLEDLQRIHGKFLSCDRHRDLERVQFQCIEGVTHSYYFEQILKYCFVNGLSLTMLGFKETGRGAEYASKKNTDKFMYRVRDLLSTIDTNNGVHSIIPNRYDSKFALLCDTKFAQNNKTLMQETLKDIKNYEVRKQFIFDEEGLVSCYIDPLNQVVMKSSYHQDCSFKYDTFTKEAFEQAWLQVRTPIK